MTDKQTRAYSIGCRVSPTPMFFAVCPREYHNTCWYCGVGVHSRVLFNNWHPTTRTRDHVVPRSAGGKNKKKVISCRGCNGQKGSLSVEEFRIIHFGLHASIHAEFYGEKRERELRQMPLG